MFTVPIIVGNPKTHGHIKGHMGIISGHFKTRNLISYVDTLCYFLGFFKFSNISVDLRITI